MNSTLSEQIFPLSIPEKLQLIEDIWESIVINENQIPLSQSQQQELDQRLASYQDINNQGSRWEDVKQRIINHDVSN
ncbi:MAG: addiction module protein [Microcystaceae cyanobacterium]